jgi:hypothetical protein
MALGLIVTSGRQPAAWPEAQHLLTSLAGGSAPLVAFVLGAIVGALLPEIAAFVIGMTAFLVAVIVIITLLAALAGVVYTAVASRAGWPQLFSR